MNNAAAIINKNVAVARNELIVSYLAAAPFLPHENYPETERRVPVGNEFNAVSGDNGAIIFIGGDPYPAGAVGTLSTKAAFDSTSPYFGVGFDFSVLGKVGMNLDFGVLWQGSPQVSIATDGLLAGDPTFEASLDAERADLENELSDYKAWPVVSLGFVFNFL